ncbi:hypothetical protein ACKWTF_003721 [Chironomus riparius]
MDLLSALPEDIFTEVSTNLSAKDVLTASLVSKGWYEMFGQSKKCMDKISARYSNSNCKNDFSSFLKSGRMYQNLIIGFHQSRIKESGVEVNIREILKKFSKSIVTLETSHDFQRICDLPALKELTFKNFLFLRNKRFANYFTKNGLLTKSTDLKKLDIRCGELDIRSQKLLVESIKNMNKLKSLTVNQLDVLQQLQATDFYFKLEELDLTGYRHSFWTKIDKIYDFLIIHRSSLKVVRVDKLRLEDIVFFLSEFPKLHTFHIRHISNHSKNLNVNMPSNTALKKMIIACSVQSSNMRQKLSEMLVYCQNLKELKVHLLHIRFINVLPACTLLRKVEYCFLSKYTPPNQHEYIRNNGRIKFISNPFSCI